MRSLTRAALVVALATALGTGVAGCSSAGDTGAEGTDATVAEGAGAEQEPVTDETPGEEPAPDVAEASELAAATFDGPKRIESEAGEACVVDASSLAARPATIEWGPAIIALLNVPTERGTVSYRFAYVDDADVAGKDAYFANRGLEDVRHVDAQGHDVWFAVRRLPSANGADAIPDLEAEAAGYVADEDAASDAPQATELYAYETRGDGCALVTTITLEQEADVEAADAEQALGEAYGLLALGSPDEVPDAASPLADLVIDDASGEARWTVVRDGRELLQYEPHRVVLLDPMGAQATATIAYDFQAAGEVAPDAQAYEVADHAVSASAEGDALHAWVDVDGSTLAVEATLREGEDVESALARVLGA